MTCRTARAASTTPATATGTAGSRGPAGAGDEAVFGGGKVIRESMGQARTTRAD
ncbi:hypothetical protein, partial [Actinomadura fibrosa]|uniref:hypothetical protein n=1 Tax=Actinomadura fibrosa TaxID=111802 RepID=UPI003522F04C